MPDAKMPDIKMADLQKPINIDIPDLPIFNIQSSNMQSSNMQYSSSNPNFDAVSAVYGAQSFNIGLFPEGKKKTLAMVFGYNNDELGFFNVFRIFINLIIIMSFFTIYFYITMKYCSINGCNFRSFIINFIILVVCIYILYKLFGN